MTELQNWLATQHPGLRTYKTFRDKAVQLSAADPAHRALYRLLAGLAGNYVTTFDEEPLPVDVAANAYSVFVRLVELGESSLGAPAEQQLNVLNEIADAELF